MMPSNAMIQSKRATDIDDVIELGYPVHVNRYGVANRRDHSHSTA